MDISRRGLVGLGLASLLPGAAPAQAQAQAQGRVTLQFWEGHSVQEETATIRMIEAFEAANPNVKVERTKVVFGGNFERITTAIASGALPDVSPIWGGFLAQFAESRNLLDLSRHGINALRPSIYPAAWSFAQWREGVYGVPYAIDPRFLAFNLDAWEEARISKAPDTLAEFYETARALTKRSGSTVERYGMGFANQTDLLMQYVNLLYAAGGTLFNADETEVAFDSAAGVTAGELFQRLVREGIATIGVPVDGLRRALLTGRVAMMIDGPWIFYAADNLGQPVRIDVAPLPAATAGARRVNIASVGAYVVFAGSRQPEAAIRFVRFMASPEAQQFRVQLLKTGVSPQVVNERYAQETFQRWPQLRKAQSYLDDSTIFPNQAKWGRVVDALLPAVEAIGSGTSPREVLGSAARQANRALRRG